MRRTIVRTLVVCLLLACEPPRSSANATLDVDPTTPMILALGTDADAEDIWFDVVVQSIAAPPGEYLLFRSHERPTSSAGLDAAGVLTCTYDCALSVPGLGELVVRYEALAAGVLVLPTSVREREGYLTLVRRGTSAAAAPMKLEARVILSADDGCGGNPDPPPPSVAWSQLLTR